MGLSRRTVQAGPRVSIEMFRSDRYADVSLDQWLALTPPELVRAHLPIDDQTIAALSKRKLVVVARR